MSNNPVPYGFCRVTGQPLVPIVDLGEQFVSDFVPPGHEREGELLSLKLGMGPTGLIQMYDVCDSDKMYRKYWYRSSVNESMRKSLEELVTDTVNFPGLKLEKGDLVVDIASNDGIMLTHKAYDDCFRIGVDPSDVARDGLYSSKLPQPHKQSWLINDYFSEETFRAECEKIGIEPLAKIVTIVAMFYDIQDPVGFLKQVKNILHPEGVLCIQLSYTPLMFTQCAFDNICHEHVMYYTLDTLEQVAEAAGLTIQDCELNSVNAGSLRVYITHQENDRSQVPLHIKDVENTRRLAIGSYEDNLGLDCASTWRDWHGRIMDVGRELVEFLQTARDEGKRVVGYGASTKGNTILQTWGIGRDLVESIAERSEPKWGTVCIGTGIPVISEAEMRANRPDYLLVLPYTFAGMFLEREKELLKAGTKFIVPLPRLQVLGDER